MPQSVAAYATALQAADSIKAVPTSETLTSSLAAPLTPGHRIEANMAADGSLDAEADQALYETLKIRGGYGLSDRIAAVAMVRLINAIIRNGREPLSYTEAGTMIVAARDRLVARGDIEAGEGGIWRLAGQEGAFTGLE